MSAARSQRSNRAFLGKAGRIDRGCLRLSELGCFRSGFSGISEFRNRGDCASAGVAYPGDKTIYGSMAEALAQIAKVDPSVMPAVIKAMDDELDCAAKVLRRYSASLSLGQWRRSRH